jgi:hypothetical protein
MLACVVAASLAAARIAPASLLQQPAPGRTFRGATTPPSGDTTGYWQQRVHYEVVAKLDEAQTRLESEAVLTYTNNSPDTLREMFVHQYLNAFRPGSKWSARDAYENRVRFQNLAEPDFGYERFTQAPTVDGTPVVVDYPGEPDSTVAHFRLPRPLAPHDSIRVHFAWNARPSTVARRQGRLGRTYDFAQWYPKVAVYDRGGWEPNALQPAGELYGEYGIYDVTMIVRDDQVLASTGVPVDGDPGWTRVSKTGPARLGEHAYAELPKRTLAAEAPPGFRLVRFVANDVHHFAWSASPDYRYEGGTYVRAAPAHAHFPTWDTVSVNVLYKPGDDTSWADRRALDRTVFALQWLESIYGPYAYPQITNVHRLDKGGTEFPMMIMDGDAAQSLILHEAGHIYTYGILGNNEWRSGWMDEGLTSYQTDWALGKTPQEQIDRPQVPPLIPRGYRIQAATIPANDSAGLSSLRLELLGRAQPIGTNAGEFSEFEIYNDMIYTRAKVMYGQLRDVLGDSTFRAFLRRYFDDWALKHVDERAMRSAAELVSGRDLGWFFDQWVHATGLMDYAVDSYGVTQDASGWRTTVAVVRRGDLRHPMAVGVRTSSGWTTAHVDATGDPRQVVTVTTSQRPEEVRLDPHHVTWDWDRRNDAPEDMLITLPDPRLTFNWPYLDQTDRAKTLIELAPAGWYSNPQGIVLGLRAKTNYLSTVDIHDGGFAFTSRNPRDPFTGKTSNVLARANVWARLENPYLPGFDRPLMGYGADVNYLDGLFKSDAYKDWDLSPFISTPGPQIKARAYATVAVPSDSLLLPEQWSPATVVEAGGTASYRSAVTADSDYVTMRGSLASGLATSVFATRQEHTRGYTRADASMGGTWSLNGSASQLHIRVYGGVAHNAPRQRSIFASSDDPFDTFRNDLFRGRGALFKQTGINYLPLGGAALRGFRTDVALDAVGAVNGEFVQRLGEATGSWGRGSISLSLFGDAGRATATYTALSNQTLADAGAGLVARGRLYDRDVYVRLDAPVFVNQSGLAGGTGLGGRGSIARRWTITVGDLW